MKRRFFSYAFVQKNYRELPFERKVIWWSQLSILFGSFLPWVAHQPMYGRLVQQNAFFGNTWLMGIVVFLISLGAVSLIIENLLNKNWFHFKVKDSTLMLAGGIQSLVLLLCIWSVLSADAQHYSESTLRFGYFVCLAAQIVNLTALYLDSQGQKKQAVMDFFTTDKPKD
jgi:hypothetical protein